MLATRHHLVGSYRVLPGQEVPGIHPLFAFLALLPGGVLLGILGVGAMLGGLCVVVARRTGQILPSPTCWLLAGAIVPAVDLLRVLGAPVPLTFLEPLLLAWVTGAAAGGLDETLQSRPSRSPPPPLSPAGEGRQGAPSPPAPLRGSERGGGGQRPWWVAAGVLAVASGVWWYFQAVSAYDDKLHGINDFGHFCWRVASTWEGRGFLQETPSLPAFWDHFNPGLALLAPLWGLWPDARLFLLIQAICLALPAPVVYGIARRAGAGPGGAVAWAAAYLTFPALGQWNLNYSYGWHPVSLALPALFGMLLALLHGRRIAALALALLACSVQEDVLVVLGCLAAAMASWAWLERRRRLRGSSGSSGPLLLADQLPIGVWLGAAAFLAGAFVVAFRLAGFAEFQTSRFAHLGGSAWEVLLAPLVRPKAFWGTLLRARSAWFLLSLLVPLGWMRLGRGRWFLLACAPPLAVLLAWGHPPATSIAFQYTTTLVPLLFLAAMAGAASRGAAARVLAASALSSLWIGAMPWSSPTLTDMIGQTYLAAGDWRVLEDRRAGSPGNAMLNQIVARLGRRESSVLATGRVAAHLLGVRRLDTVGQARARWEAFQNEVGPSRSPIELFDWVVLDTMERFQQSGEELEFVAEEARRAGYRVVESGRGIVVMARPQGG